MNVAALRFFDRYVGVPLCWGMTCLRYAVIAPFKRRRILPKRVLILKLSEMGSTVLAMPAIYELQARLPAIELYVLTFRENRAVFDVLAPTTPDRMLVVDTGSVFKLLSSGFQAMRVLLRVRIDTTIDMDCFSRFSLAIAYLVCRGNRVGFHRFTDEGRGCGDLLTHRVNYSPHIHASEGFVALVRSLFASPPAKDSLYLKEKVACLAPLPLYRPPENDIERVRLTLAAAGVTTGQAHSGQHVILLNPNASELFPLRKWPIDRYAKLAQKLLQANADITVVVTGSANETADAHHIVDAAGSPRCVSLAGRTSFPELLALYSIASVMVTNDSGPAHFASLLKLPAVVLFGPETPRLYAPLGDQNRCLYAQYACSPCVSVYNAKKSPCRDNACLKAIQVEDVLHETLSIMTP